jgi:hypothetical protein
MKNAHERQEEKRQVKLAQMEEEIKEGKLVVRKMTPEEREKYPPREPAKPRRKRW